MHNLSLSVCLAWLNGGQGARKEGKEEELGKEQSNRVERRRDGFERQ